MIMTLQAVARGIGAKMSKSVLEEIATLADVRFHPLKRGRIRRELSADPHKFTARGISIAVQITSCLAI